MDQQGFHMDIQANALRTLDETKMYIHNYNEIKWTLL